jgi:hypothetical protein
MDLGQLDTYFGAMVKGVPLLAVVFGLVRYVKKLGAEGKKLLFWSMGIGLFFGGGWMLTQERPPDGDWWVASGYWFGIFVYGLGMGVVASGIFDEVKEMLKTKQSMIVVSENLPPKSDTITMVEIPEEKPGP